MVTGIGYAHIPGERGTGENAPCFLLVEYLPCEINGRRVRIQLLLIGRCRIGRRRDEFGRRFDQGWFGCQSRIRSIMLSGSLSARGSSRAGFTFVTGSDAKNARTGCITLGKRLVFGMARSVELEDLLLSTSAGDTDRMP